MANSYDHIVVPPLSAEEETYPYASFYFRPIPRPDEQILQVLKKESRKPSEWGIPADQFAKILMPGEFENGWCIMPDGSGFSLVTVEMPGLTDDMLEFWNGWFNTSDMNYKIWFPGFHYQHVGSLVEDLGWGITTAVPAGFVHLEDLNLPAPANQLNPAFYSNETISGTMYLKDGSEEEPFASTLCHQLTRTPEGFRMLLAAWTGIHIIHGNVIRTSDKPVDPERVRLFALHNAFEFTRMWEMLPDLYSFARSHHLI